MIGLPGNPYFANGPRLFTDEGGIPAREVRAFASWALRRKYEAEYQGKEAGYVVVPVNPDELYLIFSSFYLNTLEPMDGMTDSYRVSYAPRVIFVREGTEDHAFWLLSDLEFARPVLH